MCKSFKMLSVLRCQSSFIIGYLKVCYCKNLTTNRQTISTTGDISSIQKVIYCLKAPLCCNCEEEISSIISVRTVNEILTKLTNGRLKKQRCPYSFALISLSFYLIKKNEVKQTMLFEQNMFFSS